MCEWVHQQWMMMLMMTRQPICQLFLSFWPLLFRSSLARSIFRWFLKGRRSGRANIVKSQSFLFIIQISLLLTLHLQQWNRWVCTTTHFWLLRWQKVCGSLGVTSNRSQLFDTLHLTQMRNCCLCRSQQQQHQLSNRGIICFTNSIDTVWFYVCVGIWGVLASICAFLFSLSLTVCNIDVDSSVCQSGLTMYLRCTLLPILFPTSLDFGATYCNSKLCVSMPHLAPFSPLWYWYWYADDHCSILYADVVQYSCVEWTQPIERMHPCSHWYSCVIRCIQVVHRHTLFQRFFKINLIARIEHTSSSASHYHSSIGSSFNNPTFTSISKCMRDTLLNKIFCLEVILKRLIRRF